jgi:hypothetical protein
VNFSHDELVNCKAKKQETKSHSINLSHQMYPQEEQGDTEMNAGETKQIFLA